MQAPRHPNASVSQSGQQAIRMNIAMTYGCRIGITKRQARFAFIATRCSRSRPQWLKAERTTLLDRDLRGTA
jgi:hypothetical protein